MPSFNLQLLLNVNFRDNLIYKQWNSSTLINVEVIGLISRNKVRIVYEVMHVTMWNDGGICLRTTEKTSSTLLD